MKGHVGGGSGSWRLSGAEVSVKAKPVHMSQYIPQELLCRNWLLEMSGSWVAYSAALESDIKLESLILAQNERWRHA
jgi:hypothetical protein